MAVLSADDVNSSLPFGLNTQLLTACWCPRRVAGGMGEGEGRGRGRGGGWEEWGMGRRSDWRGVGRGRGRGGGGGWEEGGRKGRGRGRGEGREGGREGGYTLVIFHDNYCHEYYQDCP